MRKRRDGRKTGKAARLLHPAELIAVSGMISLSARLLDDSPLSLLVAGMPLHPTFPFLPLEADQAIECPLT